MEDFEVPSFSLGLDQTQESFQVVLRNAEHQTISEPSAAEIWNAEADFEFESPPRNSTRNILKRLQRGPSHGRACFVPRQDENLARNASVSNENCPQNSWKSPKQEKITLSEGNVKFVSSDQNRMDKYPPEDDFQTQGFNSKFARKRSLCDDAAMSEHLGRQRPSIGLVLKHIGSISGQAKQGYGSDRFFDVEEQIEGDSSSSRNKLANLRTESDDASVDPIGRDDGITGDVESRACETQQSPYLPRSHMSDFEDDDTTCLDYKLFETNNSSLDILLRQRFPHFMSVSALRKGEQSNSERVYIDYENQFAICENESATLEWTTLKKKSWRKETKRTQAVRKRRKLVIADKDGWVQPGSQTLVNTERLVSESGAGHWVTEQTGKKLYITRDGRKLRGSSAYRQHIKVRWVLSSNLATTKLQNEASECQPFKSGNCFYAPECNQVNNFSHMLVVLSQERLQVFAKRRIGGCLFFADGFSPSQSQGQT